jgi:sigma-54 specific flagellar transcriptional regulator A
MQVKLLRVLQERTFERVGSNRTLLCNVRIIAATHRDLDAAILAGRFREDLFYRLNVFPVQMPPLRERLEDLPVLIDHLVRRQGQNAGRHIRLNKGAMRCLAANRWPGNVRELANLLERLAILYPDQTVTAEDLPERYRTSGTGTWFGGSMRIVTTPAAAPAGVAVAVAARDDDEASGDEASEEVSSQSCDSADLIEDAAIEDAVVADSLLKSGGIDLKDHLSAIEIGLIRKALEEADGTVAEAARLLKIRRTTLVEKLRKYRLSA